VFRLGIVDRERLAFQGRTNALHGLLAILGDQPRSHSLIGDKILNPAPGQQPSSSGGVASYPDQEVGHRVDAKAYAPRAICSHAAKEDDRPLLSTQNQRYKEENQLPVVPSCSYPHQRRANTLKREVRHTFGLMPDPPRGEADLLGPLCASFADEAVVGTNPLPPNHPSCTCTASAV
jgi:hypothetical protein